MTPSSLYEGALPLLAEVRTPNSARTLARILVVMAVAVVAALVLAPWQQSISGSGRVIALSPTERHQVLEAPVDGRVSRVLVAEGQEVEAEEIVIEIADVDPRFMERLESESELVKLREDAAVSRRQAIEDRIVALTRSRELGLSAAMARIEMASERVRQAEQSVVSADAAATAARLNLPRVVALADQGLRSTRDKELAQLELQRTEAEVERARATLAAASAEVGSLQKDRQRIEQETTASINDARASANSAQAEQAAARADIVRLDTRIARQMTQAVRIPRDAVVFRVLAQEGQLVKQGEPLIELVPRTTSRAVEVWVDGNDASLVKAGRPVRLQFEGWPALQFVGWPQAARGTFGGRVKLVDVHDDGTGRFRVVVEPTTAEPWPDGQVLRQGTRANGWILLEQVSLGWELWRRLNAFPPTVTPPNASASKASKGAKG
jgi:biotin carboxyl carrier protein